VERTKDVRKVLWVVEHNQTTLEWLVQIPRDFHAVGELPTIKETENKGKPRNPYEQKVLLVIEREQR
jgi:hypothetical protein